MSKKSRPMISPLTLVAMGAAGAVLIFTPLRSLHAQTQVALRSPAPPAKTNQTKKLVLKKRGLDDYAASAIALRHWQTTKVKIYVMPAADDTRSAGEVRSLVAQGVALWKNKIETRDGTLPVMTTDDPDEANIKISFVAPGSLSGGRIGVTDVLFTVPQQEIESAKIRLVEGMTDDQLVQAVAHETGHALGIQGHSDAKADLMYPYAHLPALITPRDVKTIDIGYAKVRLIALRGVRADQKYGEVESDPVATRDVVRGQQWKEIRKEDF